MEAPLVRKLERLAASLRPTWRELAAFLLRLRGADVSSTQVSVSYAGPHTVQPETAARVRKLNAEAGIPLRTVFRREAWTEAELTQMATDRGKPAPVAAPN